VGIKKQLSALKTHIFLRNQDLLDELNLLTMSFHTRSLSSQLRGTGSGSIGPNPGLAARIEEKKAELEHLRELRDLSAAVAAQMEALEQKLSTLSSGTEAIATVLANWHNVLQAIHMASCKYFPEVEKMMDILG
jgi:hypothetical protein